MMLIVVIVRVMMEIGMMVGDDGDSNGGILNKNGPRRLMHLNAWSLGSPAT